MPDITVPVTITSEVEVNIEFYCGNCGKGICSQYEPGRTTRRGHPYFTAEPCKCQTDLIKDLASRVEDLEQELKSLQ